MENGIFGFIIDNDIQFDITNKRLTRVTTEYPERSMVFGAVSLNEAMVRFLVCVLTLTAKGERLVPKQTVLKEVWEDQGLVASSQQLWKTVRELKNKLTTIGLPQDFITTIGGTGYLINYRTITPLFYHKILSY